MFTPNPKTVTVPSAGTDSPDFDLGASTTKGPVRIMVNGPAALTGTVITFQLAQITGGPYTTLQVPVAGIGTDLQLTAAAKSILIEIIAQGFLRIHSNAAEGANRDFVLFGVRMDATQ